MVPDGIVDPRLFSTCYPSTGYVATTNHQAESDSNTDSLLSLSKKVIVREIHTIALEGPIASSLYAWPAFSSPILRYQEHFWLPKILISSPVLKFSDRDDLDFAQMKKLIKSDLTQKLSLLRRSCCPVT
jgi:hypothetical protein